VRRAVDLWQRTLEKKLGRFSWYAVFGEGPWKKRKSEPFANF
jgi:hypothetical protein